MLSEKTSQVVLTHVRYVSMSDNLRGSVPNGDVLSSAMADLGARTPAKAMWSSWCSAEHRFVHDRQYDTDNMWHMPELYAVRPAPRWGAMLRVLLRNWNSSSC